VTREPVLSVEGVTVHFAGLKVLDDVSVDLFPGEVVSVIGPNGAGKTTLLNVICGFVRPDSGTVRLRGRALGGHRPHDLARLGVARTLQGVGLWKGMTAIENVMAGAHVAYRSGLATALLGLPRGHREHERLRQRALGLLERLGVEDVADQPAGTLPYGVQKRVALARALAMDPAVLLLDEPAGGLSDAEIDELKTLLAELRGERAILLIEHHMGFVMHISDRVVVLNFGRVVTTGPPDQVRTDPEVATAYLGVGLSASGAAPA
jgi:branched-chain amino acid transport system ATP-binding protein